MLAARSPLPMKTGEALLSAKMLSFAAALAFLMVLTHAFHPMEAAEMADDHVALLQLKVQLNPAAGDIAAGDSRGGGAAPKIVQAAGLSQAHVAEDGGKVDSKMGQISSFVRKVYTATSLARAGVQVWTSSLNSEGNWPSDVFAAPRDRHPEGFYGSHDAVDWILLFAFVAVLVLVDIYVLRPWFNKQEVGMRRVGIVLLFWVISGLAFNMYVGMRHGMDDGVKWFNGYLLEWALSIDNIFVFHLVFKLYKTPETLLHKALFWGAAGAILFRMLFFLMLNALLEFMHFFQYAFGIFLMWSGIQAAKDEDEDEDMESSFVVRTLRWLFNDRLLPAPHYDMDGRLLIWDPEKPVQISMLVPVIICLELTDVVFAVDSVSAKVGQIPDQFVAYSSSVFAMFGLRALFFIMEELVNKIRFLKYGLCFILFFIGIELMMKDVFVLPATVVCIVLVSVFAICISLSVFIPEKS